MMRRELHTFTAPHPIKSSIPIDISHKRHKRTQKDTKSFYLCGWRKEEINHEEHEEHEEKKRDREEIEEMKRRRRKRKKRWG
jgi:hypothetical protein